MEDRTLKYYRITIEHLLKNVTTQIRRLTTEEIRKYLVEYRKSKVALEFVHDTIMLKIRRLIQ